MTDFILPDIGEGVVECGHGRALARVDAHAPLEAPPHEVAGHV